jgi:hypothetical protein
MHPVTYVFQSGDWLCLFQIDLFSWVEETLVSLERNPSMSVAAASSTLFPCENWESFERNTYCKSEFSKWRKSHFVPNRPIQLSWQNTCIFKRKSYVLEAGTSSKLFPCENWISLWKKYFLQIKVFNLEKDSFVPYRPI